MCPNPALVLKWSWDLAHAKMKIKISAVLILLYCFFFWIQKAFHLSLLLWWQWFDVWAYESLLGLSQPFPHIDKNGEWIVGGTARGGGWLWVRTISRFNLAPAHSYCTYFHRCKVHQIGFPTQKTVSHILIANMINVLVTIVPWTRCDFSVQPRSNKKMSKCLHTFASDMGKKARERIFGCSPRTYIANPLCVWARTRLSTQHSSSSIIQKVSVNGNTRD